MGHPILTCRKIIMTTLLLNKVQKTTRIMPDVFLGKKLWGTTNEASDVTFKIFSINVIWNETELQKCLWETIFLHKSQRHYNLSGCSLFLVTSLMSWLVLQLA